MSFSSVLLLAALALLSAPCLADICVFSNRLGFCVPPSVCIGQSLSPVNSPFCRGISQCCVGYRPSSCKLNGSSGNCLTRGICKLSGGTSGKGNCPGPEFIQCCVPPKQDLGDACSSQGRSGFCQKAIQCFERVIGVPTPRKDFDRRECGIGAGCCVEV